MFIVDFSRSSRWKFPDNFQQLLSTKCKTRERCHSFDLKIVFRVGNFETLFEIVCQQNALHEKNVAVWTGKLFFALEISRHFSKVSVSEMQNTKQMSQSGPENCFPRWKFPDIFRKFLSVKSETREKCHSLDQKIDFRVGNFQPLFEKCYQ